MERFLSDEKPSEDDELKNFLNLLLHVKSGKEAREEYIESHKCYKQDLRSGIIHLVNVRDCCEQYVKVLNFFRNSALAVSSLGLLLLLFRWSEITSPLENVRFSGDIVTVIIVLLSLIVSVRFGKSAKDTLRNGSHDISKLIETNNAILNFDAVGFGSLGGSEEFPSRENYELSCIFGVKEIVCSIIILMLFEKILPPTGGALYVTSFAAACTIASSLLMFYKVFSISANTQSGTKHIQTLSRNHLEWCSQTSKLISSFKKFRGPRFIDTLFLQHLGVDETPNHEANYLEHVVQLHFNIAIMLSVCDHAENLDGPSDQLKSILNIMCKVQCWKTSMDCFIELLHPQSLASQGESRNSQDGKFAECCNSRNLYFESVAQEAENITITKGMSSRPGASLDCGKDPQLSNEVDTQMEVKTVSSSSLNKEHPEEFFSSVVRRVNHEIHQEASHCKEICSSDERSESSLCSESSLSEIQDDTGFQSKSQFGDFQSISCDSADVSFDVPRQSTPKSTPSPVMASEFNLYNRLQKLCLVENVNFSPSTEFHLKPKVNLFSLAAPSSTSLLATKDDSYVKKRENSVLFNKKSSVATEKTSCKIRNGKAFIPSSQPSMMCEEKKVDRVAKNNEYNNYLYKRLRKMTHPLTHSNQPESSASGELFPETSLQKYSHWSQRYEGTIAARQSQYFPIDDQPRASSPYRDLDGTRSAKVVEDSTFAVSETPSFEPDEQLSSSKSSSTSESSSSPVPRKGFCTPYCTKTSFERNGFQCERNPTTLLKKIRQILGTPDECVDENRVDDMINDMNQLKLGLPMKENSQNINPMTSLEISLRLSPTFPMSMDMVHNSQNLELTNGGFATGFNSVNILQMEQHHSLQPHQQRPASLLHQTGLCADTSFRPQDHLFNNDSETPSVVNSNGENFIDCHSTKMVPRVLLTALNMENCGDPFFPRSSDLSESTLGVNNKTASETDRSLPWEKTIAVTGDAERNEINHNTFTKDGHLMGTFQNQFSGNPRFQFPLNQHEQCETLGFSPSTGSFGNDLFNGSSFRNIFSSPQNQVLFTQNNNSVVCSDAATENTKGPLCTFGVKDPFASKEVVKAVSTTLKNPLLQSDYNNVSISQGTTQENNAFQPSEFNFGSMDGKSAFPFPFSGNATFAGFGKQSGIKNYSSNVAQNDSNVSISQGAVENNGFSESWELGSVGPSPSVTTSSKNPLLQSDSGSISQGKTQENNVFPPLKFNFGSMEGKSAFPFPFSGNTTFTGFGKQSDIKDSSLNVAQNDNSVSVSHGAVKNNGFSESQKPGSDDPSSYSEYQVSGRHGGLCNKENNSGELLKIDNDHSNETSNTGGQLKGNGHGNERNNSLGGPLKAVVVPASKDQCVSSVLPETSTKETKDTASSSSQQQPSPSSPSSDDSIRPLSPPTSNRPPSCTLNDQSGEVKSCVRLIESETQNSTPSGIQSPWPESRDSDNDGTESYKRKTQDVPNYTDGDNTPSATDCENNFSNFDDLNENQGDHITGSTDLTKSDNLEENEPSKGFRNNKKIAQPDVSVDSQRYSTGNEGIMENRTNSTGHDSVDDQKSNRNIIQDKDGTTPRNSNAYCRAEDAGNVTCSSKNSATADLRQKTELSSEESNESGGSSGQDLHSTDIGSRERGANLAAHSENDSKCSDCLKCQQERTASKVSSEDVLEVVGDSENNDADFFRCRPSGTAGSLPETSCHDSNEERKSSTPSNGEDNDPDYVPETLDSESTSSECDDNFLSSCRNRQYNIKSHGVRKESRDSSANLSSNGCCEEDFSFSTCLLCGKTIDPDLPDETKELNTCSFRKDIQTETTPSESVSTQTVSSFLENINDLQIGNIRNEGDEQLFTDYAGNIIDDLPGDVKRTHEVGCVWRHAEVQTDVILTASVECQAGTNSLEEVPICQSNQAGTNSLEEVPIRQSNQAGTNSLEEVPICQSNQAGTNSLEEVPIRQSNREIDSGNTDSLNKDLNEVALEILGKVLEKLFKETATVLPVDDPPLPRNNSADCVEIVHSKNRNGNLVMNLTPTSQDGCLDQVLGFSENGGDGSVNEKETILIYSAPKPEGNEQLVGGDFLHLDDDKTVPVDFPDAASENRDCYERQPSISENVQISESEHEQYSYVNGTPYSNVSASVFSSSENEKISNVDETILELQSEKNSGIDETVLELQSDCHVDRSGVCNDSRKANTFRKEVAHKGSLGPIEFRYGDQVFCCNPPEGGFRNIRFKYSSVRNSPDNYENRMSFRVNKSRSTSPDDVGKQSVVSRSRSSKLEISSVSSICDSLTDSTNGEYESCSASSTTD